MQDRALPSEREEIWRYSPIETLDLDQFVPAGASGGTSSLPTSWLTTLGGDLAGTGDPIEGVSITNASGAATTEAPEEFGQIADPDDFFVRMNDAFQLDALLLDIQPEVSIPRPVVIVHSAAPEDGGSHDGAAPASFPRTLVRLGRAARVEIVEIFLGGSRELVVPVTELSVADGAQLAYVSLQILGSDSWRIAQLGARVGRDATLRTFTVGLGAAYDRTRIDAASVGTGAHSEMRSAYLGTGSQIHDLRILQDHRAARTTSDLLCKGAVGDSARSIYSGMIKIRNGAIKSDARQTNHNLVLGDQAHADSVPNLDIKENDVRCSHASTVGPVDPDQRYYLESRGVHPSDAQRLIVQGFFEDIVVRSPIPSSVPFLRSEVADRLPAVMGGVTAHG